MLGLLRAPRTARLNSLVSFFLCAGTGLIGLAGLVHIRWNAPYGYRHPHFAYGAWIAVPLVAGLLTGALMYLVRIRNTPTI